MYFKASYWKTNKLVLLEMSPSVFMTVIVVWSCQQMNHQQQCQLVAYVKSRQHREFSAIWLIYQNICIQWIALLSRLVKYSLDLKKCCIINTGTHARRIHYLSRFVAHTWKAWQHFRSLIAGSKPHNYCDVHDMNGKELRMLRYIQLKMIWKKTFHSGKKKESLHFSAFSRKWVSSLLIFVKNFLRAQQRVIGNGGAWTSVVLMISPVL